MDTAGGIGSPWGLYGYCRGDRVTMGSGPMDTAGGIWSHGYCRGVALFPGLPLVCYRPFTEKIKQEGGLVNLSRDKCGKFTASGRS